jgi:hypothetical protein
MTVSTNVLPDFQRDRILTQAIHSTGILPAGHTPKAELLAMAATYLDMEMLELQSSGVVLRSVERATLAFQPNVQEYTLPADTFDIELGANNVVGSIVGATSADVETLVQAMTLAEWTTLSSKSITADRPSMCYVERLATVKMVMWPIPTTATKSLRYSRVRYLRANDSGGLTTDMSRVWASFLMWAVAANVAMASSLPLDRVQLLQSKAENAKRSCKAGDVQHSSFRMRVGHNARNW